MGCPRTDTAGGSELPLGPLPAGAVVTDAKIIATVPGTAKEGQMTFIKTTLGDTVFIGFKNKRATNINYDVILTDSVPFYTEDGLVIGDIYAAGSAATSKVSAYISFSQC